MSLNKQSLVALLVCSLALVGCGGSKSEMRQGSVTKMAFSPAHAWNVAVEDWGTMCIPSGQSVVCTPQYYGTHIEERSAPDTWTVTMFSCNPDAVCRTGTREVSKEVYERLHVGAWFNADRPPTLEDRVYLADSEAR